MDLHHGKEHGLTHTMRPLVETCQAAMLRTFHWEGDGEGGIRWQSMRRALAAAKADTVNLLRVVS